MTSISMTMGAVPYRRKETMLASRGGGCERRRIGQPLQLLALLAPSAAEPHYQRHAGR